jgi:competence protein ComEC
MSTKHVIATAALVCLAVAGARAAASLDIYFIDVEGGQATLIVSPDKQSLLVDTGYPERHGRDPDRIMAAVRDAHLTRIDYLLITHFHEDHDGGAAELARRIPIGTYVDYGSPIQTEPEVVAAFAAYSDARKNGAHLEPKPGDRLPLRGLDVDVVSAGGLTLARPLSGAGQANAACATFERRADNTTENPRSIGVRVRYGEFRFLDLGDLVWNKLGGLVCPDNLIGEADVYLVAHHGNGDSNVPAFLAAVHPRVAVVNNGMWKGAVAAALETLHHWPGLETVWQLHLSGSDGAENSDESLVANLVDGAGDAACWIKLSARKDGSFGVTNGRTGLRKDYGHHRVGTSFAVSKALRAEQ